MVNYFSMFGFCFVINRYNFLIYRGTQLKGLLFTAEFSLKYNITIVQFLITSVVPLKRLMLCVESQNHSTGYLGKEILFLAMWAPSNLKNNNGKVKNQPERKI